MTPAFFYFFLFLFFFRCLLDARNVVKILGIPMSSLGGVHLIFGIAQYTHVTCSHVFFLMQ